MRRCALWALGLVLAGCGEPSRAPTRAQPEEKVHTVSVDPSLVRSGRISVKPAEKRALAGFVVATGQVEAPPDAAAAVSSPISARVRSIEVRRGDRVKKGDRLALLDAGEITKVVLELERAKARRVHAERVLTQEEQLMSQDATSARAVSDAKSALATARADEHAARTLLSTYGAAGNQVALKAPIDGTVVRIDGVVGAPVEPTAPLFRLVDTTRLVVRADVPESDADSVAEGARALVTSAIKGTSCAATTESHAPAVDSHTRTVPFRVRLGADCSEFHEGAFVDVAIERRASGGASLIALARDAVVSIDGAPVVFLVDSDPHRFRPKTVRIAAYAGPIVFVEDGIAEGDRVVERGALLLKGELLRARLE